MREKLIEIVFKSLCSHIHKSCKLAENIADDLIANDVVPVVRCCECKHMEITPDCLRLCHIWNGINGMGDEGFCNYGERKYNERQN